MDKCCRDCYYGDKCPKFEVCEDFTPLSEVDEEIDEYVETGRSEYYEAWFKYIKEDED